MLMLFDYDGVIVDSFAPLLDLCIQAQASLGVGRPPTSFDFQTMENLTFVDLGRLIGVPENRVVVYSERVFQLQKRCWSVRLFPCIAGILAELARRHTLAIITASQSEAVMATLATAGLGGAISTVMGGEGGRSKAERIAMVQARLSASSQDTFMIGDAISDIREGKRAGVKTIAVSWGFQDRKLLAREKPDFLIDDPRELLGIASGDQVPEPGQPAPRGEERT